MNVTPSRSPRRSKRRATPPKPRSASAIAGERHAELERERGRAGRVGRGLHRQRHDELAEALATGGEREAIDVTGERDVDDAVVGVRVEAVGAHAPAARAAMRAATTSSAQHTTGPGTASTNRSNAAVSSAKPP